MRKKRTEYIRKRTEYREQSTERKRTLLPTLYLPLLRSFSAAGLLSTFIILIWLALLPGLCLGAEYYCDPINGNTTTGDGSYENPWGTLESVFDAGLFRSTIQSSDTVKLRDGFHGAIREYGYHNTDYITIEAEAGHTPGLRSFNLLGASKWIIRGLIVSPELAPGDFLPVGNYISMLNHDTWGNSSDCIIENNVIYSKQDSSAWTIEEWNELPGYAGINIQGSNHIVRNNTLKNVGFGIIAGGDNTLVEDNTITNFAADGLRVADGKNQIWQYNTVKNCYDVSDNHDDGLQVYTGGTEVYDLIIRGNYILEYEDPNQPFRGVLQGILCAQGPNTNFGWIVENNVVVVSWHGISIKDAQNSKIVNNLVIRPPDSLSEEYYPQITLYSDVNGSQYGSNTVIRNNMAGNFPSQDELKGVIVDHNLDIDEYASEVLFIDFLNFDFRHKQGSPAIDAGIEEYAPDIDIVGTTRPQSIGWDIGAYEYIASTFIYGDVNGNGEVTSYDAALVARYAVGLETFTDEQRQKADVSGNGAVSAYDAALIAQRAVGLIERFPVEEQE